MSLLALVALSDVADGYLARLHGLESGLGARLDSIGDLVAFAAVAYSVWDLRPGLFSSNWPALALIVATRLVTLAVAWFRWRRLTLRHTRLNKAAGVACALAAVVAVLREPVAVHYLAMAAAGAAAVEELCMELFLRDPDLDRPGFFLARRRS